MLFLFALFAVHFAIGIFGIPLLLVSWQPGLELSDPGALEAAMTEHQWGLQRALWMPLSLATLAVLWFFRTRLRHISLWSVEPRLRPRRALLVGIGLGAGLALLVGVPLMMIESTGPDAGPDGGHAETLVGAPGFPEATVILTGGSVVTELVMRGYVLAHLMTAGGLVPAVLGSALVYALFEEVDPRGDWWVAFANVALFGVVLALLRLGTGSLWVVIGVQAAWNVTLGPILGFPISGLPFRGLAGTRDTAGGSAVDLSGGAFGPEGGILCTVVFALAALGAARLFGRRLDTDPSPDDEGEAGR